MRATVSVGGRYYESEDSRANCSRKASCVSGSLKIIPNSSLSAALDRARFVARLTTGDGIGTPPPSNPRTQCDVLSARIALGHEPMVSALLKGCPKSCVAVGEQDSAADG